MLRDLRFVLLALSPAPVLLAALNFAGSNPSMVTWSKVTHQLNSSQQQSVIIPFVNSSPHWSFRDPSRPSWTSGLISSCVPPVCWAGCCLCWRSPPPGPAARAADQSDEAEGRTPRAEPRIQMIMMVMIRTWITHVLLNVVWLGVHIIEGPLQLVDVPPQLHVLVILFLVLGTTRAELQSRRCNKTFHQTVFLFKPFANNFPRR